ncbi:MULTISPECIES: hypothetical protein [Cupriavidus]
MHTPAVSESGRGPFRGSSSIRESDLSYSVFKFGPFILGAIAAQKIVVGGEFFLGEIFSFVYLFLNFRRLEIKGALKMIVILGIVWAICQFGSDQINEVAALDSIKGIGAPIVFVSTITALSIYFGRDYRRMPSFLVGAIIGLVPGYIIFPNDYFQGNPWKWGMGQVIIVFFSIYFSFFVKRKSISFLFSFVAIFLLISITNDSRNMAVLPLFAAIAYLALRSKRSGTALRWFRGQFWFTRLSIILILAVLVANAAFSLLFSSEWFLENLPIESAEKFQKQAMGEYGVLLGGRSETLVSIDAFLAKPFLGHGSWAKDKDGYRQLLATRKYELGYSDNDDLHGDLDLIPVHSYLMGALVWAGIGGGLFWIFLIRSILHEILMNSRYLGFYFYNGAIGLIWNILFSPFGANARWDAAVFVASLYGCKKFVELSKMRST